MVLVELLPFVLVGVVFWLLILRPQNARRKAQAALQASLAPGQRVMTTAGVFGTVTAVSGETVHLEIAPGVVIEMVVQAIGRVVADDVAPIAAVGPTGAAVDPQEVPGDAGDLGREADRG
jgi:preprotein translocase subunit YajC